MWTDKLIDSTKLFKIFESEPSLENVELVSLTLSRDNNSLIIILDLNDFPKNPPIKWEVNKYDTVQISLAFYSVSSIKLEDWNSERNIVELDFCSDNKSVSMIGDCKISALFEIVDIFKISAYQRDKLSPV